MTFIVKAPAQQVKHELPVAQPRVGDEVIIGTVKDVRDRLFQLWDDPALRWLRALTEDKAKIIRCAKDNGWRVSVTVGDNNEVKEVEIL